MIMTIVCILKMEMEVGMKNILLKTLNPTPKNLVIYRKISQIAINRKITN